MLFSFALSDPVQLAIVTVLGGIAMAWINHRIKMSDRKADEREAIRAEEAKKQVAAVDEVARRAAIASNKVDQVAAKAEVAAAEVKQVAVDLRDSNEAQADVLDGLVRVAHDTHVLVNNNMAIQLRLNAGNARQVAELTKGTPQHAKNLEAAVVAENLLREHEGKQAIVDSGKGKTAKDSIHN